MVNKFYMLVVLCITAFVGTRAVAKPQSAVARATVVVDVVRIDSSVPQSASGVLIDATTLVTAYHVLNGSKAAWINLGGDGAREITGIAHVSPMQDLVVAKISSQVPFEVSTQVGTARGISKGFKIVHRNQSGELVEHSTVSLSEFDLWMTSRVRLVAGATPGMSGSPIVDASGSVVGIITNGDPSESIGSPLDTLDIKSAATPRPLLESTLREGGFYAVEYFSRLRQAHSARSIGKHDEAKVHLLAAISLNPSGFAAIKSLLELPVLDQETKLRVLRSAVLVDPDRKELNALLAAEAVAASTSDAKELAECYFKRWGGVQAQYMVAEISLREGHIDEATQSLLAILSKDPWHQYSAKMLVRIGHRTANVNLQLIGARALASTRRDDPQALFDLGCIQLLADDHAGVAETMARLAEVNAYLSTRLNGMAVVAQDTVHRTEPDAAQRP